MPRAIDPSLPGGGLPITHSPLNRMRTSVVPPEFDLEKFLEQVAAGWTKALQDFILPAIEDLTGLDLSSWDAFLASLLSGTGIDLTALSAEAMAFLADLQVAFEGLDFSSPIAFYNSFVTQLGTLLGIDLTGLLYVGDPINADWLYNLIPTDLLGQISHSSIGETITNLIADPNFLDGESFTGLDQWFHDLTGGHGGTGTAWTTADGSTKELLGNLIPASLGQVMPITGKAKWTGLAGTGSPIQLAVTGYSALGSVTDQQVVASHNTTPPTTDWVDMSGTYTVPANVAAVRTRLVVGSAATAGDVFFSKLSATKIQTMFQRLIAGTNPGENLTNDVTHLFTGIITNTLELANKAALNDFNDLLTSLGGPSLTDIENRLNDFLHSLSPLNADNINTGNIADQFVPGLSTIHDALVTAVGNLNGSGFDITKVLEVLTGQTHSVVDNSTGLVGMFSRLSHLESRFNALPASVGGTGVGLGFGGILGVADTDEFERISTTSLGPLWLTSYSGGAGVWATPNGHDASFAKSGVADRDFLCIRNNASIPRSATDYQRIINVLSSQSERYYDAIFGTFNYTGHLDCWLRISDASTTLADVTGTRIRWGGDGSVSIVRFLTGAPTTLKALPTGTISPPGPGAQLIAEAGDMQGGTAGQRYFRGIIGNSLRIDVTETGTASGFGAAFRRWGHGGRVEGSGVGQAIPGSLHHWTGMDQTL